MTRHSTPRRAAPGTERNGAGGRLFRAGGGGQVRRAVRLEVIAGVPGEYTGRPSRAYEYYADDCVHWAPAPLAVTVEARE